MQRIWLLTIAATLVAVGGSVAVVAARAGRQPAMFVLAPEIAEANPAREARGVFFRGASEIMTPSAEVLLSSSPDGRGELCTDDEATLSFRLKEGAPQIWSHVFIAGDGQRISCLPPQRLTLAGGPGLYTVEITLSDRIAFTYSSRPYLLIVPDGAAVTRMTPPSSANPGAAEAPTEGEPGVKPSPAGSPVPARPQPPMLSPTRTTTLPTSSAPATVSPLSATPGPTAPAPPPASLAPWWPALAIAVGALAALTFVAIRHRYPARPARLTLSGIVDLLDRATGERRTVLLHHFPGGAALVRAPLGLAPLEPAPAAGRRVAALEPGQYGPVLRLTQGDAAPVPLRDGETLLIDQIVEVRYRGAARAPRPSLPAGRRP